MCMLCAVVVENFSTYEPAYLIKILAYSPVFNHICQMEELDWNEKAKRLLKSELVRRGISKDELVSRLEIIGVRETKTSIESKISRGTFSAAFLLQCLNAIGCKYFVPEVETYEYVYEPKVAYVPIKSKAKNPTK